MPVYSLMAAGMSNAEDPTHGLPEQAIITTRELSFARGSRVIFDKVSLSIPRGRITAILGPSGTGKTTLLRIIGGELKPHSGQVLFDGLDIPRLPRRKLFATRQRMGVLFQNGALLTDLSVYDNVAFPLRENTALPESMIRAIVIMKLEAVGLRGAAELMPAELSGGMARRVALARAIALDPELLMYDEPFAGQDPITMAVLVRLIKRLNDALGLTSVVVTHDVHEVLDIADFVYVISEGRVQASGSAADIRQSSSQWVQQFVHAKAEGPVPFHYPSAADYNTALAGGRT